MLTISHLKRNKKVCGVRSPIYGLYGGIVLSTSTTNVIDEGFHLLPLGASTCRVAVMSALTVRTFGKLANIYQHIVGTVHVPSL